MPDINVKKILGIIGLGAAGVGAAALNTATGGVTTPLTNQVLGIIGAHLPNPELKAQVDAAAQAASVELQKAELEHAEKIATLVTQANVAQAAVNQTEASNPSLFVAGWRPFVGWTCGAALAYAMVLQPFFTFVLVAFHASLDITKLPTLNTAEAIELLIPMLGLGALRTYEKVQGVANGAK